MLTTDGQCNNGSNRTGISIAQGVSYTTEVRATLREFCDPSIPTQENGASTAGKHLHKNITISSNL